MKLTKPQEQVNKTTPAISHTMSMSGSFTMKNSSNELNLLSHQMGVKSGPWGIKILSRCCRPLIVMSPHEEEVLYT